MSRDIAPDAVAQAATWRHCRRARTCAILIIDKDKASAEAKESAMVQTVSVGHHDSLQMRDYTADEIAEALCIQRSAFLRDGPPIAAVRRNRIDRLAALTFENADALADAMRQDFGNRPLEATIFSDIFSSLTDISFIRRNVMKWMKARDAMGVLRAVGVRTRVQAQPLGVVGVVAPWNFPVLLLTLPATAAFAAGNPGLVKASDN